MRLLLRIELVKTDGSDIENTAPNTVGCDINLLHSKYRSLSISLNGKPLTLHETNYHYKAHILKPLNYDSDASSNQLISSFWYVNSPGEIKNTRLMPFAKITSATVKILELF